MLELQTANAEIVNCLSILLQYSPVSFVVGSCEYGVHRRGGIIASGVYKKPKNDQKL